MSAISKQDIYELLLETGKSITSEVELEKLVQKITDIGTELSGAQFGAFFYNVINQKGEGFLLYTISGVPREAFSKFPMPRNTAIFHPTFAGLKTVRYDNVREANEYGKTPPHFGMPKGHLPVTSYLATPVISRVTGEVIGGLFFGHEKPGIFTEHSEKLIEGIAAQAAIAMTNAQLFKATKFAEQSLREQKERYRTIFHSTNDAMLVVDENGIIQEANKAASEMIDVVIENLINTNVRELLGPESDLYNAIESITVTGKNFQGIGRIHTGKHEVLDVRINASRYIYMDRPNILLVIKRTEADKKLEEDLARSEMFAETLSNVSPVTLWMTNTTGDMIYINRNWTDIVGGNTEDHLGKGWINAIHIDDRDHVDAAFRLAVKTKKTFNEDFRICRKDGAVRWSTSVGTPYFLSDGSFGGFAGSITDITERKLAAEKVISQHALINTITNNTMQALFLMDHRQHCTYMNPAAEEMTGYNVAEVMEKPLHYYIHHTHPDGTHFPIDECPIDRALPKKMQTKGEETFIRKNGEFFPVAFVASPLLENGIPVGTVIEVRETSEEKRVQHELRNKEKEAMQLLELKVKERTIELEKINFELMQFTSVASHDLKEPLRKVSIFSQRAKDLAKEFENEQFHKNLDNVIRSANRMGRLIDDLLAFARISQEHVRFTKIDLNQLLEQIKDDLQITIYEKNASINHSALPSIYGVELQIGQVFQNLISNSLKFSHKDRTPIINIQGEVNEDETIIHYSDNGIGFDDDEADRIFELFERLQTKDKFEGTGIGLAIVKKIIMMHGGHISATGVPGGGAYFTITLPHISRTLLDNTNTF